MGENESLQHHNFISQRKFSGSSKYKKEGLTGTRVWWSHCKSTRTRISKVKNGSVKAHVKSTCDRLELKQSRRYHMSPGAARNPSCVKKRQSKRERKEARTSTARAQIKRPNIGRKTCRQQIGMEGTETGWTEVQAARTRRKRSDKGVERLTEWSARASPD